MRKRTLVFVHIPKTAGQTLLQVLRRQYEPDATYATKGPGPNVMDELAALPEAFRAQLRLVYGHMPFGAHRLLPGETTYLAFLRDPVERAVSHFEYVRRTREHRLHREVVERDMTLHEYVESSITDELDNGQTALLAGTPIRDRADFFDPELLEQAKRNIEGHFALVGLVELFDESLLLAKEVFGWQRGAHYRSVNVSPDAPSRSRAPVPDETHRLIADRNRLDAELHRFARERLEAQIGSHGPAFRRRVRRFRFLNAGFKRAPPRVSV